MSHEFKNFSLQIPTMELADNSSLIKKLNDLRDFRNYPMVDHRIVAGSQGCSGRS